MKRSNPFSDAESFVKKLKEKAEEKPKATLQDVEKVLIEVKKRLDNPFNYPWYIKLDRSIDWSEVKDYLPGDVVSEKFGVGIDWISENLSWHYNFIDFSVDNLSNVLKVTRKMKKLYEELAELDNRNLDGDAEIINRLLEESQIPRIAVYHNKRRIHPYTRKLMVEKGFKVQNLAGRVEFYVEKNLKLKI